MLKELEIKVGVPYKGSGVLNSYGQWSFTPSQVGSREGQKMLVKQDANYTLYSTKKKVVIYITLERDERMPLIAAFCKVVDKLLLNFKDYDFRRILPNKNKGQKDK